MFVSGCNSYYVNVYFVLIIKTEEKWANNTLNLKLFFARLKVYPLNKIYFIYFTR